MSAPTMSRRERPNVMITGTPGVGKTTLSEMLAERAGMKHLQVGRLMQEKEFHSGYNAEFDTLDVSEEDLDRLCDFIEPDMDAGGAIVDYSSCDYFPERWFDLVVVLRTSNDVLWPRLVARGYSEVKVGENIQAEIMAVVEDEAVDAYPNTRVMVLASESVEQMAENVAALAQWVAAWRPSEAQ